MYMLGKGDFGPLEMWATGYDGQVKIKAQTGLGTSTSMILTWAKNLLISTDAISNAASIEFIAAPDRSVNYFVDFKLGAQIKYTNEVVLFVES